MVIDVKNDHGMMSYCSKIPIVAEVGANNSAPVKDMKAVLDELHSKGIFPIARIVVFKDPLLAEQKPEWAIRSNKGGIWRDRKGVAWIDPTKKCLDYNIAIARRLPFWVSRDPVRLCTFSGKCPPGGERDLSSSPK